MGPAFRPHPFLASAHLMSIVPGFLPRRLRQFVAGGARRLFTVDDHTRLLAHCHFHDGIKRAAPTLILLHGLEGSSESSHVIGIGYKAYMNGFNVVRLNMRNCGGSMEYARTLYNAGLHSDIIKVLETLAAEDKNSRFVLAGYSLGGNLLLSAAADLAAKAHIQLLAVCAVSPSIDLNMAVEAIERPENRLYQDWFLKSMKQKILAKFKQHPDLYDVSGLEQVKTMRDFDDRYTAPNGGYGTAINYYNLASAKRRLKEIKAPTLMIASKDDPLVPIESFTTIDISNDCIELLITEYGGHGGFFQDRPEADEYFDRFWAENRVVAFLKEVSSNT